MIIAIIIATILSVFNMAAGGDLQVAERGQHVQVVAPPPPPVDRYHHPEAVVDQWHDVAIEAGWPEDDWPRLACVIWRESRGYPFAHNPRPPDDSYGLIQLNMRAHWPWVRLLVDGYASELFDPYTNLMIGRTLFDKAVQAYGDGWQPWIATNGSCPGLPS